MSNWKQQQREQRYQRWQEEQSRKEAAEKRAQQNAILKANGYQWKKVVIGDGGDANSWDFEWILLNPAGEIVSVSQALKEIESKAAAKPHLCYNCSDKYVPQSMHHCHDEQCQCGCRQQPEPTGHALMAPEPERHEETNAQPEPEQETLEAESSASTAEPKDALLAFFGINNPDRCYRCQSAAKERGDYCESCAAIIDAEIAEREAEQRAEDEAAGAAWKAARDAGKSVDEQWHAYEEVKASRRGGARPGAGRKPTPEKFDQRSYQAGYQAGLRAVKR